MTGLAAAWRRAGAACGLVLFLTGCTVGPDHVAPVPDVASTWSSPHDTTARRDSLVGWWRRFDDPALDSLVTEASANNTDVAQALARLRKAREGAVQSGAALAPTLDLSAGATAASGALGTVGGVTWGGGAAYSVTSGFSVGFDASFELDIFGGKRRDIERANASADASEADLADTLLSVLGDVAANYVALRASQARLGLARRTVGLREDSSALARARASAGMGTGLDVLQAQAELESARAAIPPLEQSTKEATLRLAVLTAQTPASIEARLSDEAPIPKLAGSISPDPPLAVLARRPDIRAAERRIAAATANIGVAEAARLPAVSVAGSLGLNSSRLGDLTRIGSNVWSIGPTVDLPIFDAGRRASVVRERAAARDEAIAAWRGKVGAAVEDVEKALSALDRERAHEVALRRSVRAYANSVSVAQALYVAGVGNYADVVTSQRSLTIAEDVLVQSQATSARNAIALFKALGGGWDDASRL